VKRPEFVQLNLLDKIDRRPGKVRRDVAIEKTIARAKLSKEESYLVTVTRKKLVERALIFEKKFTGDDVALLLDLAGIPREMILRRRLTSAIMNGGRGTLWRVTAEWRMSQDPLRNARRVPVWELITEEGASWRA
jgi:hypothetical protein